ncbi:spore protease YyaC [Alkalicoccus daliensis]|uniref:Putative sporulation protein YyaC n=1 Tax=Alkalicoccus daliensis TaxID=745820 RepID=A0A1H0JLZ6_9BACI|nr:spore protease YyaC [Alkalicoccus daliensis]SDO44825.1 putative sporulation protein YyaC [Alkalicoccus daliensis]
MREKLYVEQTRFLWDAPHTMRQLSEQLRSKIPADSRPLVLICIGTDRSTGDSLGPLTGTFLKERRLSHFHVYGTLEAPVHAKNLQEVLQTVQEDHQDPFVIAVDACLGSYQNVGTIVLGDGPLLPGSALGRDLPPVGDIYLTGIVNVSGFMELSVLQSTRLYTVMNIAKLLAGSLKFVDWKIHREQEALIQEGTNVVAFQQMKKEADSG